MSTTSEFLTGSPISNVPHEILQEIFTHCLLQNPLGHLQPDTTVAPILLCHVCSSWRMVALALPTLWAHLSYQLAIARHPSTDSTSWTITYDEREIEYIRWWRRNQGSVAPFLSLEMRYDDDDSGDLEDYLGNEMAGDGMDFLLEYIASAQYLELDNFFWSQVYLKIRAGYQVAVPNLHTLIFEPEWLPEHPFDYIEALIQAQTQPVLRRLSIVCEDTILDHLIDVPNYWSTLTHISLHVVVSLKFWFSIAPAVPNLRWAHFEFTNLIGTLDYPPAHHTLPRMTTLSVVQNIPLVNPVFPLSILFTGLHLPSLRTLTLSSPDAQSWKDDRAIIELYNALKSAPAITKLVLVNKFLSLGVHTTAALLSGMREGPVWSRAVQLTHLQLDIPYIGPSTGVEEEENILNMFVHNIFSADNGWLDLPNRACPIRTITMCSARSSIRTRDLVMSKIQEQSAKAPDTVFQITSDAAHAVVAEVRNDWIWGR